MQPSRGLIRVVSSQEPTTSQIAPQTNPSFKMDNNNYNVNNNSNSLNTNQPVKILRRPKPVASQSDNNEFAQLKSSTPQSDSNNTRHSSEAAWNGRMLFSHVVLGRSPTTSSAKSTTSTTSTTNSSPSFSGPHLSSEPTIYNTNASKLNASAPSHRDLGSKQTQRPLNMATSATQNINNNNNKPPRTYQERADDYAKARLRILGSAFPDDGEELTNTDDNVNRLINSNFTQQAAPSNWQSRTTEGQQTCESGRQGGGT